MNSKVYFYIAMALVVGSILGYVYGTSPIPTLNTELSECVEEKSSLEEQIMQMQEENDRLRAQIDVCNIEIAVEQARAGMNYWLGGEFINEIVYLDFWYYEDVHFTNCTIVISYGVFKLKGCIFTDCTFIAEPGSLAEAVLLLDNFVRESSGVPLEQIGG